jgi:hypothetical protein
MLRSMKGPPLKIKRGDWQKHFSPEKTFGGRETRIPRRWRGDLSGQTQKISPSRVERYIVSERTARTFPEKSGKASRSFAFDPTFLAA